MGRKNRRTSPVVDDGISEIDIPTVIRPRLETREERDKRLDAEFGRRRERQLRRIDERVGAALDWTKCCIPGCGTEFNKMLTVQVKLRDPSEGLPLCTYHETIVGQQWRTFAADEDHQAMRQRMARRYVAREVQALDVRTNRHENGGHDEGQIYFVRLNELIKIGWSGKLRSRLKSYGASAEVLCHYPGTRQDETLLHRQLRDNLARGREWYHDCPAVQLFIERAIKQHGRPSILPWWTEPKADLIRKHRTR